jgi:50S ribosomal protein L16 3-hydroxylase
MIHFGQISKEKFLADYWQKKPLLLKSAIPNFTSPLSPDELAGLSCEDEFESRIIQGSTRSNTWSLENGPFDDYFYENMPKNDWTLLVQGVDKHILKVYEMIEEFDFIPRWRIDDVMVSFAAQGGSVGPHYDHYDVFLLQGLGSRLWQISSLDCNPDNYVENSELRIMKTFREEDAFVTEPGDILYIPPGIAHHGVSLNSECITLSFGYRSYSANEMLEALDLECDKKNISYYIDPIWLFDRGKSEISISSINQALKLLNVDKLPVEFFGCFVTRLDPFDQQKFNEIMVFEGPIKIEELASYILAPICRIAYQIISGKLHVFINGEPFNTKYFDNDMLIDFCNSRVIKVNKQNILLAKKLSSLCLLEKISDHF